MSQGEPAASRRQPTHPPPAPGTCSPMSPVCPQAKRDQGEGRSVRRVTLSVGSSDVAPPEPARAGQAPGVCQPAPAPTRGRGPLGAALLAPVQTPGDSQCVWVGGCAELILTLTRSPRQRSEGMAQGLKQSAARNSADNDLPGGQKGQRGRNPGAASIREHVILWKRTNKIKPPVS